MDLASWRPAPALSPPPVRCTQVGTNRVTSVSRGGAIREVWTSVAGVLGTSLTYYDPATAQWHQH
ncbi:MAG: hypothetical protein AAF970_08800 [Bacteroidota bacterium]